LQKLKSINQDGVSTGFLLNYRDLEETYWVEAGKIQVLKEKGEIKSLSVEWCRSEGIRIDQSLKRTRYYYDIPRLLRGIGDST